MENCVGFTTSTVLQNISCELKSYFVYPLVGFKNSSHSFILKDKEKGMCGSANRSVDHPLECLKFLWYQSVGCRGEFIKDENWDSMSIEDIKKDMISYHFTIEGGIRNIDGHKVYKRYLCLMTDIFEGENLAFRKPISFPSGSYEDLLHPTHVVDGVEFTEKNLGGCSNFNIKDSNDYWLIIDFLSTKNFIRKFIITTPNCCDNQTISIYLNNAGAHITHYEKNEICVEDYPLINNHHNSIHCTSIYLFPGRYATFKSANELQICEIKAYSATLSSFLPAFSSSATGHYSMAYQATIDNPINIFETSEETKPWFGLSLLNIYITKAIDILSNRKHYLENAIVYVTMTHPSDNLTSDDEDFCGQFINVNDFSMTTVICPGNKIFGQYVTIIRDAFTIISFETINVWGYFVKKSSEITKNIALKKPVWASSQQTFGSEKDAFGFEMMINDGIYNFKMYHSRMSKKPWICIDLLQEYLVFRFRILIRPLALITERFSNMFGRIENTRPRNSITFIANCFNNTVNPAPGSLLSLKCFEPNPIGRYAIVFWEFLEGNSANVPEIEVLGILKKKNLDIIKIPMIRAEGSGLDPGAHKVEPYEQYPAKAIDGYVLQYFGNVKDYGYCSTVSHEKMSVFTVYFDGEYDVSEVTVVPRYQFSFLYEYVELVVGIQNSLHDGKSCYQQPYATRRPIFYSCPEDSVGNMLSFYRGLPSTIIHICEIIAYGAKGTKNKIHFKT
ncbi:DgyrCDS1492 [Dimorphilus gyrociliatus]|uniref:DgyrCDS1492 n=1 Tax=Dimorphilus gyrociliatus TaxID=2664684 RepID=A0A7I8V7N4_9ANNE|nr:DgyrCDS1492 [Dimorphilus gyrociliatus]